MLKMTFPSSNPPDPGRQFVSNRLIHLGLTDREDPATLLVAQKVIEDAKLGQLDPEQLRSCVVANLSGPDCQHGAATRLEDGSIRRENSLFADFTALAMLESGHSYQMCQVSSSQFSNSHFDI
jgi:hypothetical protein